MGTSVFDFCWLGNWYFIFRVIVVDVGKRIWEEIQVDESVGQRKLRYELLYLGKVYKVKLNDGKEGK